MTYTRETYGGKVARRSFAFGQAIGGAVQDTGLQMELIDYVPVYRTPACTGGGWAFARWQ
jgi:hypothetical protein